MLARNIFREYDIRGLVGHELNISVLERIGRAVGSFLRRSLDLTAPSVSIGRDCRTSSPGYHDAFIRGLMSTGCHVVDVGMVPTPVLYFAHHQLGTDAGVVITASHNPREYNGLKLRTRAAPIFGPDLQTIYDLAQREDFEHGEGRLEHQDVSDAYLDAVCQRVTLKRPLKLVLDTGNGVAGPLASRLYRRLGCEVTELYTEPDGSFPNHLADPTIPRFMADLIARVLEIGADLGIGLDGDGDRMGGVDEQGMLWPGDRALMLFARDALAQNPGRAVVFDVKCSQELVRDIEAHGGQAVMWKTGYPLISQKLIETRAIVAGEMSGHIYFADNYFGYDDGMFAGARLLGIVAAAQEPMSRLLPPQRTVTTPELRLPCADDRKFAVVEGVLQAFHGIQEVIGIDGARILFDNGWGLIRASNTQPALVARFEADSPEQLAAIMSTVQTVLNRQPGMQVDLDAEVARGGGDH